MNYPPQYSHNRFQSQMNQSAYSEAYYQHDGKSAETRNLKAGELSTGTTIMAIPFENGVIMGADSRTSTGTYVADRVSNKLVQLHDSIWACRSGSAADTQALTDYVRHYLSQLAVETGRAPTVKTAAHLMRRMCYENKDNLMAGVIIGGWDPVEKGSVYNIPLGGTCIKMPFAIGGSGSGYIYGLVDSEFKPNLTKDEALTLVQKAISHAMARDGSSGGVVRTVVVTQDANVRNYIPGNRLPYGPAGY